MEKTAQLLPITVLESPYDYPITDPKDAGRKVVGVPVGIVPDGFQLVSLKGFFEEYRRRPETRQETVEIHDVESFVEFVNRYKHGKSSVVFIEAKKGNKAIFTAIFDYHPEGPEITDTGAAKFRAVYPYGFLTAVDAIQRRVALPFFRGKAP